MAETYTSVKLLKDGGADCKWTYLTTWIRTDHGVKGKRLRLKRDGKWDGPWEVIEVYGTQKASIVKAYAGQYRKTRGISDVDRDGDREKVTV